MDKKTLEILSTTLSIVGLGITLLNSFIGNKKLDFTIEKKIQEALKNQ